MTTVLPPFLEGLYDTYVYYENNFTSYDYPEGVFWKYQAIMRPGVAVLHSGLPERTTYNDPYNLYVVILSWLISMIIILVQGFCARTIWKNKSLSSSVKWFLLAEVGMKIQTELYTLYTMQCTFDYSCVDDTNYPFCGLFFNQIWSATSTGRDYIIDLWALGMSFSRIFAIFFNGMHYQKVERLTVPYIGIVFVLVNGFHFSMIGKGRSRVTGTWRYMGYFFMPNIYASFIVYFPSYFHFVFLNFYFVNVGYVVVGLSLAFDSLTLWKIRKMKKLSSNTKNRADFKLAVMMMTTHCFNALLILLYQLNTMMFSTIEPLHIFLIGLPTSFFPIIDGLTVTAFNYPFKAKNKQNRVFNQRSDQAGINQNRATDETQVTKLD